jgi:hypothetical protein
MSKLATLRMSRGFLPRGDFLGSLGGALSSAIPSLISAGVSKLGQLISGVPAAVTAGAAALPGIVAKAAPVLKSAGGAALAGYTIEQIAEALGVRGGAGFFGAAPGARRRRARGITGSELRGFKRVTGLLRSVGMRPKGLAGGRRRGRCR